MKRYRIVSELPPYPDENGSWWNDADIAPLIEAARTLVKRLGLELLSMETERLKDEVKAIIAKLEEK